MDLSFNYRQMDLVNYINHKTNYIHGWARNSGPELDTSAKFEIVFFEIGLIWITSFVAYLFSLRILRQ